MYRLRAQKISIDLPDESSEPWVHAVLQKVFKDENYENTQVVNRTDEIYRKQSEFLTETNEITDPVTQQTFNISGAGMAEAIRKFVIDWMQKDKGGTINEHNHLIKED